MIITAGSAGTIPFSGSESTGTNLNISSGNPGIQTVFVEPNDRRAEVLKTITNARKTINLTIFQLDDPEIVAALAAAQNRGVSVRVIYNNASFVAAKQTNPNEYGT